LEPSTRIQPIYLFQYVLKLTDSTVNVNWTGKME
jgi:hypothetical protein